MSTKHLGKLHLSQELLLSWLQFGCGDIKGIRLSDDPRVIEIILEHPEMPEVREGDAIWLFTPSYTTYQDAFNKVSIREPF